LLEPHRGPNGCTIRSAITFKANDFRFGHHILDAMSAILETHIADFGALGCLLQAMVSLLYFCGMTGFVKERLFQRYFSLVSIQPAIKPNVVGYDGN